MGQNQMNNAKSDSSDTIAMVIEIAGGMFGFLGLGWIYAKNLPLGIGLFVGWFVVLVIEILILLGTFGMAGCFIVPFNIIVSIISGIKVRDYVRNSSKTPSLFYLLIAIGVALLLICIGTMLFLIGFISDSSL